MARLSHLTTWLKYVMHVKLLHYMFVHELVLKTVHGTECMLLFLVFILV